MSRPEKLLRHASRPDDREYGDAVDPVGYGVGDLDASGTDVDSSGYSSSDLPGGGGDRQFASDATAPRGFRDLGGYTAPAAVRTGGYFGELAGAVAPDGAIPSTGDGWTGQHAIRPAPIEYPADRDAVALPGL